MSSAAITAELREYAIQAVHRDDYMAGLSYDLDRIADRIDEECERDLMALPRDMDGVPIHIGDVMVVGKGVEVTVDAVCEDGFYYHDSMVWMMPSSMARHLRMPSAEDILVDFHKECQLRASELGSESDEDREKEWRDIAGEYANKLRELIDNDR